MSAPVGRAAANVYISRCSPALFAESELIILDEVLSGMDLESRNKVESLIDADHNKTYIIISHEPINNINFTKKYKISDGELSLL